MEAMKWCVKQYKEYHFEHCHKIIDSLYEDIKKTTITMNKETIQKVNELSVLRDKLKNFISMYRKDCRIGIDFQCILGFYGIKDEKFSKQVVELAKDRLTEVEQELNEL